MPKRFWKFQNLTGGSAELLLYGDISDSTWWGDEVTPKKFAEDLQALGAVSEIRVRINSGGGDVFAAQAIGNLLEQHTANVIARIDGLCASSATIDAVENIHLEAEGNLDEGSAGDRALTVGGKDKELYKGEAEREYQDSVAVKMTGDVTLDISGVSIKIGADGKVTIRSSGKIDVKAEEIKLSGNSQTMIF